jgi:hypothetical protein
LRAVHYFGHAHPTSFWDSANLTEAPAHFSRIRADGFDAVIFVVPWRGFQRRLSPPSYDETNMARLRSVMAMAHEAGLKTILRVSYPWSSDPDSVGSYDERILALFGTAEAREAWRDYLVRLRCIADDFDSFEFAFFSWEDMPSTRELMVHRSLEERRRLAGPLGWRDHLASRHDLARIGELFGEPLSSLDDIYVPLADCEAYEHYVHFINAALFDLLEYARGAWPGLAMQVRVDWDALQVPGAHHRWVENDIRERDPALRVTYWFPFMYIRCDGQTISAAEALASLERMLLRVSDGGRNTNHFLDQFVFYDESPHFGHFPRIDEREMKTFLREAARLMQRYSRGYGLWNYFDYRVNHFYNPIFVQGLQGWIVQGEVRVEEGPEPRLAWLAPGASIAQRIDPHARGYAPGAYTTMKFSALARVRAGVGRLALVTDDVIEAEATVRPGDAAHVGFEVPAERHRDGTATVAIVNAGSVPVAITDVSLAGVVYRSRIYDEHGREDRFAKAVRAMNRE